jgi:glycerophosphoryl diester phosphodiesterase
VHPYLAVEPPIAMAHRGFSRVGLENTMEAFGAAVELGLTHVETDVHATRDGRLVAFHDHALERVTDGAGEIADLTWAQVSAARVVGSDGARAAIPLLADVLGTWPTLRVNIDVKAWPAIEPLADVLRRADALGRVCVTAFDDRRTAAVRRLLGPALATSPGPRGVARWRLGSLLPGPIGVRAARLPPVGHVAVQVPEDAGPLPMLTPRSIATAHAQGLQVHVWTVDEPDRMRELLALGVDGLLSDRADLLADVVAEHRRAAG